MRAVTMQDAKLTVAMIPDPVPGPGEVLVDVLACGICGTDLHCAAHAPELNAATKGAAGIELMDLSRPIVFGHEFVGRVVSYGPGAENRIPIGRRVCRHAACQDPSPTTGSQYRSPRCASTTTSARQARGDSRSGRSGAARGTRVAGRPVIEF
jgi:threonine dehydrogenase-like Zn-dependent dehydrogenase